MATRAITSEEVRENVATLPNSEPATTSSISVDANGANGLASTSTSAPASPPETDIGENGVGKQRKTKREPTQPDRFDRFATALRKWWREVPSWLASLIVHTVALVALGLWYLEPPKSSSELAIVADPSPPDESLEDLDAPITETDVMTLDSSINPIDAGQLEDVPLNPLASDTDAANMSLDLASLNDPLVRQDNLLKTLGVPGASGQGMGGRSGAMKGELLKKGGTDASEAAVARGLKWLARHQMPDGGWSFDIEKCPTCHGLCKNAGEFGEARLGATAMALLPFLGAGQTHREGQYKEVVRKGLYYLTTHTKNTGGFLSMHEPRGTMYSHGLGTIALCEAYAMTNDQTLMPYAQGAINFIVYAQDPVGGGWRYQPREDGDTSVVGWQVMALKSAQMAGLEVSSSVLNRATKFLDSVQSDDGANYGYTAPSAGFRRATASVGLLCRMYMGWKKDNRGLQRGIASISREGPSMPRRDNNNADMYYNYYATQVLRHWGGYEFDEWNSKMRDWLVESQEREGHETGSWYFDFASHGRSGGRLYTTSVATMILEVYYRHLPIYGGKAVDDEFSRK